MAKHPKSDYYVYSTLSNDNIYRNHAAGGGDVAVPIGEGVLIKGRANIPDGRMHTPKGVVTGVTADELDYLRQPGNGFAEHEANGFIVVSEKAADDPDDVAADMEARDGSAPLTPGDLTPEDPTPKEDAKPAAPSRKA